MSSHVNQNSRSQMVFLIDKLCVRNACVGATGGSEGETQTVKPQPATKKKVDKKAQSL